jgi:hypothetical protein
MEFAAYVYSNEKGTEYGGASGWATRFRGHISDCPNDVSVV